MKQMLGHDGPPQGAFRKNLLTGEPLALCPIRSLQLAERRDPRLMREVETVRTELFPPYRDHGLLPLAGGVLDQPARTMDMLRLFGAYDKLADVRYTALRQPGDAGEDDG